jgi:hypothetical protein
LAVIGALLKAISPTVGYLDIVPILGAFRKLMDDSWSPVKCTQPAALNWMDHAIGKDGFRLYSAISTGRPIPGASSEPGVIVGLDIQGPALEDHKVQLDEQLGEPLEWYAPHYSPRLTAVEKPHDRVRDQAPIMVASSDGDQKHSDAPSEHLPPSGEPPDRVVVMSIRVHPGRLSLRPARPI